MSQRKTYFLSLQMLLSYLDDQSCELTTTLKISGKTARGTILLKEGKVVFCLLQFQNGSQIVGAQAYKQLESVTQWQVELEQAEEKGKTSFSAPSHYVSPLRQKRPLDLSLLQNLSRRERSIVHSVFATINGQRNNEEIKAQLHFSSSEIDSALVTLRLLDLIE